MTTCYCKDVEWDDTLEYGVDIMYYVGCCPKHGKVYQTFAWNPSDGFEVASKND